MTDRRAFVVVLDACGAGELPDTHAYGDDGADTLVHVAEAVGGLHVPTLERLGLGNIRPIAGVAPSDDPVLHGRLHPLGPGKDSTTGHWELMGVVTPAPLPTYPHGFPGDLVARLEEATGHAFCANHPSDGIKVLADYGEHHLETGELILYTSADSVLQIAAHTSVLPEADLHDVCRAAREVMTGEHAVGRVIARPFEGEPGAFRRTLGRHDYSVHPPSRSCLEAVHDAGVPVHCVGKTYDLFAGIGIDHKHPGASNAESLASTTALVRDLDSGLVFVNCVETDQLYGHRHDTAGFHTALQAIDDAVAEWLSLLRDGDLLVITADHGVDPTMPHHDHTREHVPLLARFGGHGGRRHDGPMGDVGASAVRWLLGGAVPHEGPGTPFAG